MRDNRDVVQKADFLLAQLAPGGLLEPAQADRFLRLAIDASTVLPLMTSVTMKAPKELREVIRYGSRALRAGNEATALPVGQRSRPDTGKVELDAKLAKAETRVSFEALEDSIEGGTFESTVRDTLAERISLDLEDLAMNGNTASPDDLLKLLNGFRAQTVTHTVNAGGATLSRTVLKDTLKTMPSEFRRDKRALRFMTADEAVIDYHESIADRMTPLGDQHVAQPMVGPFESIPVIEVPVFPTNLGGPTNQTEVLLTDPANMLFGAWRNIRVDTDRDIQAGVYIIVVSLRVDFKFAHEPASVKTTAVRAV